MARSKVSVTQSDWSFGEVDRTFIERSDTDILSLSSPKIRNMRILNSGAVCDRPGSCVICPADGAVSLQQTKPEKGKVEGFVLIAGGFKKLDKVTGEEKVVTGAPWTADDIPNMYSNLFGDEMLVGSHEVRPQVIDIVDCTFEQFEFATKANGSTAQPYYNFNPGVTLQPDTTSGAVVVTASDDVFDPSYVGRIIRIGGQEIEVTGYTSPTEVTGTYLQDGNPTYQITLSSVAEFSVNDAIYGETSLAGAIITDIDLPSGVLTVIMDDTIGVFQNGENIIGPDTNAGTLPTVNADPVLTDPAATFDWDEQVFSDARGWPGYAACHQGRMIFVDICQIPNAYMLSEAGDYTCFEVGSNDGDAIFDQIGKGTGERLLYAVSSEDLLIFSDENVYYMGTRGGNPISPTENNYPVKFSSIGAAQVEPVLMDDSVAYVAEGGNRIIGATLAGDAQRYWTSVHLSEFAPHLIRNPQRLGTSEGDSDRPEQYLFVANEDGTLAVLRFQRAPFDQRMGWVLWETKGKYIDVDVMCNQLYAIVERDGVRQIERFDDDVNVDGGVTYQGGEAIPDGLHVWGDRYWGEAPLCYVPSEGEFKAGCTFTKCLGLWPRSMDDTGRRGFVCQRNGRVSVVTQDTASYTYNGQRRAHYDAGDDLTAPPCLRQEKHRFASLGRFDHAEHAIEKPEPGPLCVLSVSMEVQG